MANSKDRKKKEKRRITVEGKSENLPHEVPLKPHLNAASHRCSIPFSLQLQLQFGVRVGVEVEVVRLCVWTKVFADATGLN